MALLWKLPASEQLLLDDTFKLEDLILTNRWRLDNLTPGLDLIDDFWDIALKQEENYELAREKLFFKF